MQKVSVLIPVFNEEERLKIVFDALVQTWPKEIRLKEIIFVDDGSTDQTVKIIKRKSNFLSKNLGVPIKLISYKQNRGKGYAVKKGMQVSIGDLLLLTDVDMSTPFTELEKFFINKKTKGEVIVGTRKNGHSTVVIAQPLYRQVLGKMFTYLTQFILRVKVSDFTCGFKIFNKNVYKSIYPLMKIDRWGYDAEILFLAKKNNFVISEVPVLWANDQRSKVNIFKDMVRSLFDLFNILLNDWRGIYTPTAARDTLKVGILSWLKI